MSMYRCSRCDALKDGDCDVCTEDLVIEHGLVCESCSCELDDDGHQYEADQRATHNSMRGEI